MDLFDESGDTSAVTFDVDESKTKESDCISKCVELAEKSIDRTCGNFAAEAKEIQTSIAESVQPLLVEYFLMIDDMLTGEYVKICGTKCGKFLLSDWKLVPNIPMFEQMDRRVSHFVEHNIPEFGEISIRISQSMCWLVAVALLKLFQQTNYTGPAIEGPEDNCGIEIHIFNDSIAEFVQTKQSSRNVAVQTVLEDLQKDATLLEIEEDEELKVLSNPYSSNDSSPFDEFSQMSLCVDGFLCLNIFNSTILLSSRLIFLALTTSLEATCSFRNGSVYLSSSSSSPSLSCLSSYHVLWASRCTLAHTRSLMINFKSDPLYLTSLYTEIQRYYHVLRINLSFEDLELEMGLTDFIFQTDNKGEPWINKSMLKNNLELQISSALGRKHADQPRLLPYLSLSIQTSTSLPASHDNMCIILAKCLLIKRSNPDDDVLTREEMMPYLTWVINQSQYIDFVLHVSGLYEKALIDVNCPKIMESGLFQLQALIDEFHSNNLSLTHDSFNSISSQTSPVQDRLKYLHKVIYPPIHELKSQLALYYVKFGALMSAMKLFKETGSIIEACDCLLAAGRRSYAKQFVLRLLSSPTVTLSVVIQLLACLGDVSASPSLYELSWNLSQKRYIRARQSQAYLLYKKGLFSEAIGSLEDVVRLNPNLSGVQYKLGMCFMFKATDGQDVDVNYHRALDCLSNVIRLSDEYWQAWGNMGSIHLKLGNHNLASQCLHEAIKLSPYHHHWQLADNLITSLVAIQDVDELITVLVKYYQMKGEGMNARLDALNHLTDVALSYLNSLLDDDGLAGLNADLLNDTTSSDDSRIIKITRIIKLLESVCSTRFVDSTHCIYSLLSDVYIKLGNQRQVYKYVFKEVRSAVGLNVVGFDLIKRCGILTDSCISFADNRQILIELRIFLESLSDRDAECKLGELIQSINARLSCL